MRQHMPRFFQRRAENAAGNQRSGGVYSVGNL